MTAPREFGARFEIESEFDLPLGDVRFELRAEFAVAWTRDRLVSLEEVLAREQSGALRLQRDATGRMPVLHRYVRTDLRSDDASIAVGPTDYAEYLATNVAHPEWRGLHGDAALSDALGISGVLVGQDGRALLARRGASLAVDAGRFHVVPSGHPFAAQTPTEALLDEARGELGLESREISALRCLGVARATGSGKPELICCGRVACTLAELEARPRAEAWEHDQLFAVEWESRAVLEWLGSHAGNTAAAGLAALAFAGRASFGAAWFAELSRRLSGAS